MSNWSDLNPTFVIYISSFAYFSNRVCLFDLKKNNKKEEGEEEEEEEEKEEEEEGEKEEKEEEEEEGKGEL